MKVDLKDLRYVAKLAETGSVTAAAELLGCVQSNVTNRIKRLEHDLDLKLFTRSGGRMLPSFAAEALVDASTEVEATINDAVVEARRRSLGTASLRIGVFESFATTHLSIVMDCLKDANVFPITGPSAAIAERVRKGVIDFGIISQAVRTPDLEVCNLLTQQFAIARPKHCGGEDLDRIAVIRGIDAVFRAQTIEAVTRLSGRMPTIVELGSLDAIRSLVEGGIACAFLPEPYFARFPSSKISVTKVSAKDLSQTVCIVRRPDNHMDSVWEAVIAGLQDSAMT